MGKKNGEFVAPEISVGSIVIWSHGSAAKKDSETDEAGSGGNLAIVTEALSNGRCRLAVLATDNTQFTVPEDPVPHASDPFARRIIESDPDAGVWSECPTQLNAAEVATLRAMIAEFVSRQAQKTLRNQGERNPVTA